MENIHYWKISPDDWGSDHEGWENQWSICIKEKKIAMGWSKVGDLSELILDQIKDRLRTHYKQYETPKYKTRLTLVVGFQINVTIKSFILHQISNCLSI